MREVRHNVECAVGCECGDGDGEVDRDPIAMASEGQCLDGALDAARDWRTEWDGQSVWLVGEDLEREVVHRWGNEGEVELERVGVDGIQREPAQTRQMEGLWIFVELVETHVVAQREG